MIDKVSYKGHAKCVPAEPDRMLLPFQERWRADKSRLKICEKSRQIGWTWTDALSAMETAAAGFNDVWVSSRDELQAKLYIDDSAFWAKYYQRGAKALGLQPIAVENGDKESAYVLRFPVDTFIYSLSSNPNAQAGKRGTRKLDEFALHKDPKLLYDIAYPGITWGGSLDIFSTHRGAANYFNTLIREITEGGNPKGFSHHKVTLEDALDQGLLFKLQQRLPANDPRQEMDEQEYFDHIRAGATDESAFQQEYMCVPEDESAAFITQAMLEACSYATADNLVAHESETYDDVRRQKGKVRWLLPVGVTQERLAKYLAGKEIYVGVDYGRNSDLTVVWVLEKTGGMFLTRAVIEMFRHPFYQQAANYNDVLSVCHRACLDSTGMGESPVEDAIRKHGSYRIEGVRFSNQVKEALASPVRPAFEDRATRIPYDKKVHADFRKVKKDTTAAGNIRFIADSDDNGHADRFWAFALALHASKTPQSDFKPVVFPRRNREERSVA